MPSSPSSHSLDRLPQFGPFASPMTPLHWLYRCAASSGSKSAQSPTDRVAPLLELARSRVSRSSLSTTQRGPFASATRPPSQWCSRRRPPRPVSAHDLARHHGLKVSDRFYLGSQRALLLDHLFPRRVEWLSRPNSQLRRSVAGPTPPWRSPSCARSLPARRYKNSRQSPSCVVPPQPLGGAALPPYAGRCHGVRSRGPPGSPFVPRHLRIGLHANHPRRR